jgi:hypothetical protein
MKFAIERPFKIIKKFTVEIGGNLRLLLLVVEFEEAIGNGYLCVEAAGAILLQRSSPPFEQRIQRC